MSTLWDGVREGCGSCEYRSEPATGGRQGQCRRYPPVLLAVQHRNLNNNTNYIETEQQRPWVADDDWCGEWKRTTRA